MPDRDHPVDEDPALNVLGEALAACSLHPMTGYLRDGYCQTGMQDPGSHCVCAAVTADFLAYSRSRGNDLIAPRPEFDFPGLKPGDRWCLCTARWAEAREAGVAPPVVLNATHARALDRVSLAVLKQHALDLN